MGTIAEKLTYLNTTKTMLRDSLNKFGSNILTNDTFRSYDTKLNDIYDKLPKITQSGAGFTLSDVQNGLVDDFKMIGTDLYQNQLPSEYTAVEYLQSDNECFIDTGINADYKLSLKMKVACLDSVLEYMGAIKNIDNTNYIRHHLAFAPTAGNIIGIYYGQTNDQLILKEFDNNFHEFNLDIYNKKVSIDNNSTIAISYNNFDVGINYYLFARNSSNIEINKGTYKIYYCKMYYEDKLVRDFAPCYRNSDNVAGLYDFVTNTFFTNQGTGTFTVGNTITLPNPDYPQEIKVVEGRQVINISNDINNTSYNIDLNLENIYLAKMPDTTYKNRIYKNNGNWYFEENVKKVVLDGSEDENWGIFKNSMILENLWNNKPTIMCDYFKPTTNSSWVSDDDSYRGMCSSLNTAGQFRCMPLTNMTLAEFKTWLSTHNVIVWYELQNPVTTQITNTTLINQLDAISVHTGTNIITISNSNNIIPEIEITRLKELEKLA